MKWNDIPLKEHLPDNFYVPIKHKTFLQHLPADVSYKIYLKCTYKRQITSLTMNPKFDFIMYIAIIPSM